MRESSGLKAKGLSFLFQYSQSLSRALNAPQRLWPDRGNTHSMLGENKVACSLNFHACFILLLSYSVSSYETTTMYRKKLYQHERGSFPSCLLFISFQSILSTTAAYSTSLQQNVLSKQ
jgi:hypothetical protein